MGAELQRRCRLKLQSVAVGQKRRWASEARGHLVCLSLNLVGSDAISNWTVSELS